MKRFFQFALISLFYFSCASVSSPSGGPKDLTPPKVLSSNPDSAQINFSSKKIVITFDEYFVLNNIQKELIISPPVEKTPKIRTYKRTLIIEFHDSLLQNTTYTLNFGEGIKDLNEGNTLNNYSLVFSTGSQIDSMSQSGILIDAITQEPLENIQVFLYKEAFDSNLLIKQPYYVCKTDEHGHFEFQHISNDSFSIYALEDVNRNFRMEKEERIAFLKHRIFPHSLPIQLRLASNSTKDTLRLLNSAQESSGSILFVFNQTLFHYKTKIQIKDKQSTANLDKKTSSIIYRHKDTIRYYPQLRNIESDSFSVLIELDTFRFIESFATKKLKKEPLKLTGGPKFSPHKGIYLRSNNAIKKYNSDLIEIYADSTPVSEFGTLNLNPDILQISSSYSPNTSYQIILKPGAITDVHSQTNTFDTIHLQSLNPEETGTILCSFTVPHSNTTNYVVELMKGEKVVETRWIQSSEELTFSYLSPGKYTIRAYKDENSNYAHDLHDMLHGVQAETYFALPQEVEVRANWEVKDLILELK